jgi:aubergine-like protein
VGDQNVEEKAETRVIRDRIEVERTASPTTEIKRSSQITGGSDGKHSTPTQTQFLSVATSASKSIERAVEEIKVEHIMRRSPVRKVGEAGVKVDFSTNYIKLLCRNKGLYQYVVQFSPQVDAQFNRIKYLYHIAHITGPVRLFDGHTLFLPVLLPEKTTEATVTRKNDNQEITMRITLTKILPPEQIPPTVFNIIFKNIMKELKMTRIGQHYFSSMRQIDIPNHNLQIWPGYVTAVHEFEDGLYLVVDVAHKVLRSQTCWELMNDLHNRFGHDMQKFREEVFNALIGSVVLTRYNNRTYKIDDILWDNNPNEEFSLHNGERITYHDYYKKHYNISIRDLRQPLLMHRPKKNKKNGEGGAAAPAATAGASGGNGGQQDNAVCLVPELCYITGLSTDIRADTMVIKVGFGVDLVGFGLGMIFEFCFVLFDRIWLRIRA